MSIHKEPFGATNEGVAVERYHLINKNGRRVCILTYGGIVQTLEAADREGNVADMVLGFDRLQPYLGTHPYFGAIVGRYANRIAHGRFTLMSKDCQLAINNRPHHLHGGIRGFDKQVWRARVEAMADGSCLVLRHVSADGDEGYPGTLTVEVKYSWSDHDALRIDYNASTDRPTILNLTNHSYFNLAGISLQNNILQHRMQLNADYYLPVDATLIPTGEQANVAGCCMDFRVMADIGACLNATHAQIGYANGGYDHAWLLNAGNEDVALAAIVEEPVSGRRMQVYTTQPAIQFYTGNFLDGSLVGKNNIAYSQHAGFCLETQHYPDAPNHLEFPTTVLHPGAVYQQTTVYQFDLMSES